MTKNLVFYNRTKHIAINYHFLCEAIANGENKFKYYWIVDQLADIFTKALLQVKFELLQDQLRVSMNNH